MRILVHPDTTGYAPSWARFYAYDDDTYDGAPDSHNRNHIGVGSTPTEAIANLLAILADAHP